jgi:hypothetical protein
VTPLRLLVYDRTCVGRPVGLSSAWATGAALYRALGRLDAVRGVGSWAEALEWLAACEPDRPISEIQYWGHGRWGRVLVDRDPLDVSALSPGHPLHMKLEAVRQRLIPAGEALVWLRTCEAFGADAGLDFARRLADFFGSRVAGHTHIIGALQSGLHGLRPGHTPDWSPEEGIAEGSPEAPLRALHSIPGRPRTITCFDGAVPPSWFA